MGRGCKNLWVTETCGKIWKFLWDKYKSVCGQLKRKLNIYHLQNGEDQTLGLLVSRAGNISCGGLEIMMK